MMKVNGGEIEAATITVDRRLTASTVQSTMSAERDSSSAANELFNWLG